MFGVRLARALDALLLMQQADAAQLRGRSSPQSVLFTTPTGTSLFEADCLTRHYLCNDVSLLALVAHHATLRIGDALDGLDIMIHEHPRAALGALCARVTRSFYLQLRPDCGYKTIWCVTC